MVETYWKIKDQAMYPKLKESISADVAIIGGGLVGVLSAYTLSKAGKSVALIEENRLGQGATYLTTAFLTNLIDTDYSDLIKTLGLKKATMIADSHTKAINFIHKITKEEKIEDEFHPCSGYIYAKSKQELKAIKEEAESLKKVGIDAALAPKADLGFINAGYIEVKNQARFHPIKFIDRLGKIITKNNGKIFEKTKALEIKNSKVITQNGEITAKRIISATYAPFNEPLGLFFKKAVYISYVVELLMPKGNLIEGIYQDPSNPYRYFRIEHQGKNANIILGGEDHRADIPMNANKKYRRLLDYARDLFGQDFKVVRKWQGPIMESIDGLAYIGEYKNNLYATGFSGTGMTYAAIAAMMLSDIINGKPNQWQQIYDPKRLPSLKLLSVKGRDYFGILWNSVIKELL